MSEELIELLGKCGDLIAIFGKNFPQRLKGYFRVKNHPEEEFVDVDRSELCTHRFIEVNTSLISLIALEFDSEAFEEFNRANVIEADPNFVLRGENMIQAVFMLERYIPRNSSAPSLWRLYYAVLDGLEDATGGRRINDTLILSPFYMYQDVKHLTDKRYMLKELLSYRMEVLSQEELERQAAAAKERRQEAGRKSASARKSKTVHHMYDAIALLIARNEKITQGKVAELAGLNRRTVVRNWRDPLIMKILIDREKEV